VNNGVETLSPIQSEAGPGPIRDPLGQLAVSEQGLSDLSISLAPVIWQGWASPHPTPSLSPEERMSRVRAECQFVPELLLQSTSAKPYGPVRYRFVAAGWLEVSPLGPLHVVFSRNGTATQLRGLVTDAPELSAADVIRSYEQRWPIEPWVKDMKPWLGLGHDQNRPYWAAVTPRHLVGLASAFLTHRRSARHGAQGQRPQAQAAAGSTATAQEQLWRVLWEALATYRQETCPGQSVLEELERLRMASQSKSQST
jgi:hypothetical protein